MADRTDRLMTGMFRDREAAERAYECVTSRGYTDKDVSLLMSDDTRTRHFPKDAKVLSFKPDWRKATAKPMPQHRDPAKIGY